MKLSSSLFLLAVAARPSGWAAAFSPRSPSRMTTTRTFMQGKQMESYLDSLGNDASHAILLECDNEGCGMVEADHDNEGWHYGEGHSAQKDIQVVMLEKEDTE
mmetsp:Transcript_15254/g.44268  ORF Transcript_15254/g.44268 Transcript_15254/m.44268 type:complete len:103 (-) Transcript_15254:365-673(-)|eukprot:CAMPEP_0113560426 /NCGR_PEP_ID=MMETSP0015_2-20120614/19423_1 /TAXON_ID=2838 /ORGANISM="Odontella" /LENGTH=102 /DNA_ID=CAMNT_0000462127 /DNA_START=278 /DNA_END=586 /DNA_ORIENTATION=+ /assembly_acc=CAM_ASM_000160